MHLLFSVISLSLFLRPIVISAGAVILFRRGPKLDKAAAFPADAVFKAAAASADFQPAVIFFRRGFDVLRHDRYQIGDLFIQPLGIGLNEKTPFADGSAVCQHSSTARTEQAGSFILRLSQSRVTPS